MYETNQQLWLSLTHLCLFGTTETWVARFFLGRPLGLPVPVTLLRPPEVDELASLSERNIDGCCWWIVGVDGTLTTPLSSPSVWTSGMEQTRSFKKSKRLSASIHCFLKEIKKLLDQSKNTLKLDLQVSRTESFSIFIWCNLNSFGKKWLYKKLQCSR